MLRARDKSLTFRAGELSICGAREDVCVCVAMACVCVIRVEERDESKDAGSSGDALSRNRF